MGSKSQACRTISQEITADCAILCPRHRVDGNECLSIKESSQEMMLSEGVDILLKSKLGNLISELNNFYSS